MLLKIYASEQKKKNVAKSNKLNFGIYAIIYT